MRGSSRQQGVRLGFFSSLLLLSPVLIGISWFAYRQHVYLPEPLEAYNSITSLPQISEARILETARVLSEDIGFRTPGTREHAVGEEWLWDQVTKIKQECDEFVRKLPSRKLECEIWHQKGSGSHRFDMMGARLYKSYVNLGNIVMRISDGTQEGKKDAVLVNAHLDSTLPTPGAADDALCVGIMLECIRVLLESEDWEPKQAVVFLFNNAEESLQDGSHLFSTQHEVAPTIRAVINLEAAGSTGRELLFQATSKEMIKAYSHVPRPHGTVIANDIFSSGIIMSDTDFRQFEEYLNVGGLDMAIVANSYLYHMRKDLVENIQPGVAQNFGENVLAILRYLSMTPSPSDLTSASPDAPILVKEKPEMVYFSFPSIFGKKFWMYSFGTAQVMYTALFGASLVLIVFSNSGQSGIGTLGKPVLAVLSAFFGSLISVNIVALFMKFGLDKPMSWFKSEYSTMALYGPAGVVGALASQLPFVSSGITERQAYHAVLLLQSFLAVLIQFLGVGSAVLFFLSALNLWMGLALEPVFVRLRDAFLDLILHPAPPVSSEISEDDSVTSVPKNLSPPASSPDDSRVSLLSVAFANMLPAFLASSSIFVTLDVFVPLTGRMGANVPADNLIATIVAGVGSLWVPGFVPFVWRALAPEPAKPLEPRVPKKRTKRVEPQVEALRSLNTAITFLALLSTIPIAIFSARDPFDAMHQKRVYAIRTENITTNEHHLHLSTSDGAPGFQQLVNRIAEEFADPAVSSSSGTTPKPILMDRYNGDWDVMFPFSLFLTPYKIPLAVDAEYVSTWNSSRPTLESSLPPSPEPTSSSSSTSSSPSPSPSSKSSFFSSWFSKSKSSSSSSSPESDELNHAKEPIVADASVKRLEGLTKAFSISAMNDTIDLVAGTRSLTMSIWHPGLIWTVVAFDAHVLAWNLDGNPPDEYTRHHVKEASYYGSDTWTLDLVVKLPEGTAEGPILVNFIGIEEEGMWPGKRRIYDTWVESKAHSSNKDAANAEEIKEPSLALKLFSTLDAWTEKETNGQVDLLLLGCVAGVQWV